MLGLRSALLSATAGLVLCAAGGATPITTTSFSTWQSDLTGSASEVDFTPIQYKTYNTASGLSLSGFVFTGPDNGAYQISGYRYNGFVSLAGGSNAGASLNVATPASGENALWVSFGSTASTPLTLTLSDGESYTLNSGGFGLVLTNSVTSFSLTTTTGSQAVIDDLWFGNSSLPQSGSQGSTPEPAAEGLTIVMVVGGSLVLFGARRKFAPTPAS